MFAVNSGPATAGPDGGGVLWVLPCSEQLNATSNAIIAKKIFLIEFLF
jgi:hypothetical protein